jgi:threonine synthase
VSYLLGLVCSSCDRAHPAGVPHNRCDTCGQPLLARYDLDRLRRERPKPAFRTEAWSLWRYRALLPLADADVPVSLGESVTPLLRSDRLGHDLDLRRVFIKDEGRLPTGSFKARGAAVGVTMARALGIRRLALPTAGNAGGAWAAYGARAGCTVLVAMPRDAPLANQQEVMAAGAELLLVPGTISDAGRAIAERGLDGYFDAGTFREPYRVEGKKTIAFELAEQLGWRWPSVIVYPTGGAVGLIGIWKAVTELAALGWVNAPLPRLVAVQAAGCAPLVTAFQEGANHAEPIRDPHTVAPGIRVPSPLADRLALRALRESGGTAIAVSDADLLQEMRRATRLTGILWSPEGAATIAGVRALRANGWLAAEDEVVLLNTGSGLKTLDLF